MKIVTTLISVALLLAVGCGEQDEAPGPVPDAQLDARPAALPAFASLDLYAADSPLNQMIPIDAEIDPDSASYVGLIVSAAEEGGFVVELGQYSAPVFVADDSSPLRDVTLACGEDWAGVQQFNNVRIPDWAVPADDVDGSDNPIQYGECGADADQDNQMIVLNLDKRCEYDFFQARRENGYWVASWANGISMDSSGIYAKGYSSRGSGFTTLAGLIWPDELAEGVIHHAMGFAYPYARAGGPVAPASESDGLSEEPWALPEGARLRLDPTLDLSSLSLTPVEMIIAKAMQDYGIILFDDGSFGVSIEAIDPDSTLTNPYADSFGDTDFPELPNIPLDRLQLLKLGPQNPNADDNNELVSSECADFQ